VDDAGGDLFGAHAALADASEDFGQVLALDVDGEDVAGADGVGRFFEVELIRHPAQLLARDGQLALADVRREVDDERARSERIAPRSTRSSRRSAGAGST
jgi:hypothetical protein